MQEAIKQAKMQQTTGSKETEASALDKIIASAGDLIKEE